MKFKKISLLLSIFLLLTFTFVSATDFYNFSTSDIYTIEDSSPVTSFTRSSKIRSQFYNNSWYIAFSNWGTYSDSHGYISKFNDDFTVQEVGWSNLEDDSNANSTYDFQVGYPDSSSIYIKYVWSVGSAERRDANKVLDSSDLSLTYRNETGYNWGDISTGGYSGVCSHSDRRSFIGDEFIGLTQQIQDVDDIQQSFGETPQSNANKLYLPSSSIESGRLDIDYNARLLLGNQYEYVLSFIDDTQRIIYADFYRDNDMSSSSSRIPYKARQELLDASPNGIKDHELLHISRTNVDEWVLVYLTNDEPDVIEIITYQLVVEDNGILPDSLEFVKVNEYQSTLPNIDATGSLNQTSRISASFDGTRLWLFYNVFNTTDNKNIGLYGVSEYIPCECSDWVNTGTCVDIKMKQTRSCNPDNCDDEIQFVNSTYCEKEYNRTLGIYTQGFEKWYSQNSCETDWIYVGEGIAECSPNPITINPNCINVTSKLEVIPEFDTYHTLYGYSEGCVQGNFHLTSCNPSYECFEQNYSCYQLNISQEYFYNYYTSGDIVTGKGSMYVDNVCKCKWGAFNFGIRKFKLRSTSTITCDIACEEKWTCINDDYKGLIHIDCSQTNVTFCDYGCVDGACVSLAESESELSAGYWFNKFFNPDKTMKFFYSFFFSLVVGVIGLALGKMFDKNNKHGGILFMIFFGVMFSFFALVTWIPPLIIIMIIFFVLTFMGLKALGK